MPEFVKTASLVCEEVYEEDACDLPFDDKEFDWVFCSHTLEHCLDLAQAINELRRTANKVLFIVVPVESEKKFKLSTPHHHFFTSPDAWLRRLLHPEWNLIYMRYTENNDVEFIFTRGPLYGEGYKEHLAAKRRFQNGQS